MTTKARLLSKLLAPGGAIADGSVQADRITGTVGLGVGGTGAGTAPAARSNLGLAIGSDVQQWHSVLDNLIVLAGTSGFLKKHGSNNWQLDTNTYLTGNQTITFSGDATGSGATTVSLTLANSGVTAGTYGSSTAVPVVVVDAKGRVTSISTQNISGALTFTGDVTGTGSTGSSTALTLANSGVTAGTYTKVTVDAKGRATSGTTLVASDIPSLDASKITSGTIDAARLPSYVDDVLEYTNLAGFPATGETGKIYLALDTNKAYRWSGSAYVYITSGAVDSVAGKTGVVTLTSSDVGLGSVENKNSATIRSEITSANVTAALGFTPYNSTNPSGYITSSALSPYLLLAGGTSTGQQQFNANVYVNGNFGSSATTTTYNSQIKFDNSFNDVARGPNKIELYNSSWLAGLGIHNNTLAIYSGGVTTFYNGATAYNSVGTTTLSFDATSISYKGNAVLHAGNYSSYALPLAGGTVSGVITSSISSGTVLNMAGQSDSFGYNTTAGLGTYIKGTGNTYIYGGGSFYDGSSHRALLHAGNYNSYSPTLTGTGASGTWGINVTGSANTLDGYDSTEFGSEYWRNVTVNGDANTYYPVVFANSYQDWSLYLRKQVHDYGSWDGTLTAQIEYHSSTWGGDAGYVQLRRLYQNQSNKFLASWGQSSGPNSFAIVWLRGGGRTYQWRASRLLNAPNIYYTTTDLGNSNGSVGPTTSLTTTAQITSITTYNASSELVGGNTFLHSGNYSSYALPLSGGTLTGSLLGTEITMSGSILVGGARANNAYASVTGARLYFGGADADAQGNYYIGTNLENFGGNYNKLDLRWHTGIRMGAQASYGGIRFYDSEDLGSVIFSVGTGDANVRVANTLIANGISINQERANNARIYSNTTGGMGLLGVDSGGSFRWQLYGEGTNYGFLNGVWAGWDIRKTINGDLFVTVSSTERTVLHSGNYSSYALPLSGGTVTGTLNVTGNTIRQGNNLARPLAEWSASGSSTGMVYIELPGGSGNYGMIHAVIDVYEYNGNSACTIVVGGHNWNSYWVNYGVNIIGQTNKTVRLGFRNGKYVICIGSASSGWDYGTVMLRKIHNASFYNNIIDMGAQFVVAQTTSESLSWDSGDIRATRLPATTLVNGNQVLHAGNFTNYAPGSGSNWTFGETYSNGWFRNNNSNQGLYNQSSTQHWSSNTNGYWDASSTTSFSGIRFYTGGHVSSLRGYVYANTSNEIGFLNTSGSWSWKMDNSGNGTATGNVTAYSDERLKKDWNSLSSNFIERLAEVKNGTYTRTDTDMRQVGVSAQSLQQILPEAVLTGSDENKTLSVAYGNAALAATVELAKRVVEQQQQIAELTALVKTLLNKE